MLKNKHPIENLAVLVILVTMGITTLSCITQSSSKSADTILQNSGLPVPRFVSLRSQRSNMRAGPRIQYPVKWIYTCRDCPAEVIAEFGAWRRVRDWQGSEGWIHKALLSGRRTFIVLSQQRTLLTRPAKSASLIARLEPGAIGDLLQCPPHISQYCLVKIRNHRGWLRRGEFWGVRQDECLR